ncbi:hypothetical protein [Streptomyces sp. AM6-12]|uniref:hypothetical protein n=1 Tax=Streptomyces sp. AM6-12 TaxID=3345149 RepID=UPI0037A76448
MAEAGVDALDDVLGDRHPASAALAGGYAVSRRSSTGPGPGLLRLELFPPGGDLLCLVGDFRVDAGHPLAVDAEEAAQSQSAAESGGARRYPDLTRHEDRSSSSAPR